MLASLLAAAVVAASPRASGTLDFAPAWSPDGTEIAFIHGSLSRALYVVRPDGSGLRRLAAAHQPSPRAPAWSPDSKWLAFNKADARGDYRIFVIQRDGTHLRDLGQGLTPVWSPDGRELAYIHPGGDLYVRSFPRGKPRLVAPFADSPPTWSPDGTRIASAWNNVVFVVGVRTTARAMVSGGRLPSWSPDGSTIAVLRSCVPVFVKVGTFGAPGGTDCGFPVGVDGPAKWSPDGTRIVYGICFSGFCDLEFLRAQQGAVTTLRGGEQASWSPDGTRFVYVHTTPPGVTPIRYELYVSPSTVSEGKPLLDGG